MMNPHQTALTSLLLGSFPNFSSGDSEGALGAYELVMSGSDERDLQPGVMILINGEYPGHDGRFAPTAPQLATAIRMARDKRMESERRSKLMIAPPPPEEIPEDERERVKAGFDSLISGLAKTLETEDAAATKRRRELFERTNARFLPDMSDEAVAARLGLVIWLAAGVDEINRANYEAGLRIKHATRKVAK